MTELSEHKFEEINIGLKKNFNVKMNTSLIASFAEISGDFNPLHTDEKYAKTTTFGKPICHGMLLASFLSRLVGMYLPGKNALYFSQSLNFQNPCYVDDEIIVEGEVIDKSISTRIISIKTTIKNQADKCLLEGIAKVIVRE